MFAGYRHAKGDDATDRGAGDEVEKSRGCRARPSLKLGKDHRRYYAAYPATVYRQNADWIAPADPGWLGGHGPLGFS